MEILAERAIHTMNFWCVLAIGFFLLVVIDIIVYCICDKEPSLLEKIGVAMGLCLTVLFVILGAKHSIVYPVMEYKVRFVEKIDMEEFLNTYEIRDKDGSIITIRCLEPSAPSEETINQALENGLQK